MKNKIYIGSDHAGFELKQILLDYVKQLGYEAVDCGTNSLEAVDYPDITKILVNNIALDSDDIGILLCGSGIGMSIAANRNSHIRAALCCTPELAHLARAHNDANVLVLGARYIDDKLAQEMVEVFLNTKFEGGRHSKRIAKIDV